MQVTDKLVDQVKNALLASDANKQISRKRYHRSTAPHPGFRTSGDKKTLLINKANLLLIDLGSKGVNIQMLLKMLGIEGDSQTITTKKWTGVIGALVQFKKDNGI